MLLQRSTALCIPFLLQLSLYTFSSSTTVCLPDHYFKAKSNVSTPQQYIDPTLPSILLPPNSPSCTLPIFSHAFANTYGSPPATANYNFPSACPPPWSFVVLDFSVSCAGEQYDRVAGVWLNGAEILRTTTAEPDDASVFWKVRKDITKYSSLLARSDSGVLSVMLENIVNEEFTGIYHVNVTIDFYYNTTIEFLQLSSPKQSNRRVLDTELGHGVNRVTSNLGISSEKLQGKLDSFYLDPADLIIPVSSDDEKDGSWFRIHSDSDVKFKSIQIPGNTYRAVLEIYVSFHGDDEFWYSNPPDLYIQANNLTTGRGNGSFRQVFVIVDREFIGSVVPFPVIFTGGINPLLWEPVVAIGAFDLPSYSLELTPFLGLLLDGKPHDFGLGVTDGISFWLIDANLHLWLDSKLTPVIAKLVDWVVPNMSVFRQYVFFNLNGSFCIEASRMAQVTGWVNSSLGNFTTVVDHKQKSKSIVRFKNNGNLKEVRMNAKAKTEILVKDVDGKVVSETTYETKYPLKFKTSTSPMENNTYTMISNLSHVMYGEFTMFENGTITSTILFNKQVADGYMIVQDHSVLSGSAQSNQTYQYNDANGCYSREIKAKDGVLVSDDVSSSCSESW